LILKKSSLAQPCQGYVTDITQQGKKQSSFPHVFSRNL